MNAAAGAPLNGLVVAAHGRHCWVEDPHGQRHRCHHRGKKSPVLVGDLVLWQISGDEGSVEQVLPRRNLLYRQDELRTKSFAANLDQVLLLLAADPVFSENQLTRALIATEAAGISALIVLNKSDLGEAFESAWQRLLPYQRMGYTLLGMGLKADNGASAERLLAPYLAQRRTLILGPSGVGKSSLVNRLVPNAQVQTGEVSRALNSGRHTTTSTNWYWIDGQHTTALIDSPGFQSFGLQHIPPTELAQLMPDLRALLGDCRFHNCSHLHEPGCSVRSQVGAGPAAAITEQRWRLYTELHEELSAPPRY